MQAPPGPGLLPQPKLPLEKHADERKTGATPWTGRRLRLRHGVKKGRTSMLVWTRIFTLVAVAAVVAVVTGGAGATSTSTPAPGTASRAMTAAASRGALLRTAKLNTLAGAARYLRAIG